MASFLPVLTCADSPSLGRFDPSMITYNDRMALFFVPDNAHAAQRALSGDSDDPTTWKGVLTDDGCIARIVWSSLWIKLRGSIDLTMMPSRLTRLHLSGQELRCEVELTQLPETMKFFEVIRCRVTGTVDLNHLPSGIEVIKLKRNALTALRDIDNLPSSLREVSIVETLLEQKSLNIAKLPFGISFEILESDINEFNFARECDKGRVFTGKVENRRG